MLNSISRLTFHSSLMAFGLDDKRGVGLFSLKFPITKRKCIVAVIVYFSASFVLVLRIRDL